jgi:hypothetical protein
MVVTSRFRTNSEAHKRGAIDISSRHQTPAERLKDARAISKGLGKDYAVIVEVVTGTKETGGTQKNTSYRDGKRVASHVTPITASATHTHVQPDREQPAAHDAPRPDPRRFHRQPNM